jgi:hypothetical protein
MTPGWTSSLPSQSGVAERTSPGLCRASLLWFNPAKSTSRRRAPAASPWRGVKPTCLGIVHAPSARYTTELFSLVGIIVSLEARRRTGHAGDPDTRGNLPMISDRVLCIVVLDLAIEDIRARKYRRTTGSLGNTSSSSEAPATRAKFRTRRSQVGVLAPLLGLPSLRQPHAGWRVSDC